LLRRFFELPLCAWRKLSRRLFFALLCEQVTSQARSTQKKRPQAAKTSWSKSF
jgi:hypothetical protein